MNRIVRYMVYPSKDIAKDVEEFLAEGRDRRFYDDFTVDKTGVVELRGVEREKLVELREQGRKEELSKHGAVLFACPYMEANDDEPAAEAQERQRLATGHRLIKLGEILAEQFCPQMRVFNIMDWNWSIPEEWEQKETVWYAVPVWFEY